MKNFLENRSMRLRVRLKSRSVREKNVIYRNLKTRSVRVDSEKMTKIYLKNSTKSARPLRSYGRRKKIRQVDDFQGVFRNKSDFEKKSQNMRFAGPFTPKNR